MATTITIECPKCHNRMKASSEFIGQQGRCPSCKSLVEIRAAGDYESLATLKPTAADGGTSSAGGSPTEVSGWKSGLIGVAAAVVLYVCIFLPLQSTQLGSLFLKRGPIPYVVVLVTCWGLAILAWKYLAVKGQQSYADLELELIPLKIGLQITPSNVDQFLDHLGQLPAPQRRSILGRRIHGALDHFKSRNSVPEVQEYLATQAEIDSSGVDSGYTLLRAFIWAVPILGFIGTVMGISAAVSGLGTTLGAGGEIMDGLGLVTAGLSTAFDTTLIALVMAIILLFPTESLRKIEYNMLDRIESFANESLLRRMNDEQSRENLKAMPEVVKNALQSAFQEHQNWLAQWQAQVRELGQVIGGDFEQVVTTIVDRISQSDGQRLGEIERVRQMLAEILNDLAETTQTWHAAQQESGIQSRESLARAEQLEATLTRTLDLNRELSQQQSQLISNYAEGEVGQSVGWMKKELERLMARLDGKSLDGPADGAPAAPVESLVDLEPEAHVPVPPTPTRSRGSRFGFFKRRS